MNLIKSSLVAGNGSVQTFLKDGLHVNSQPISEYLLFEAPSVAANTIKIFNSPILEVALIPLSIWFTPSVKNIEATFSVRSGAVNLYTTNVPTTSNVFSIPIVVVKPNANLAIFAPTGLTLTNVLIIAQAVYINEVIS